MSDRADLVGNERAKLTAAYANNVAVALFVVGVLTPAGTTLQASLVPSVALVGSGALCIVGSLALHLFARHELRKLVP